ncbi:MAG: helix-turn-helix domain-containing protein [Coriobacteriaceae bacterium]|jgi:excisionase family DNA binding protein|nr:helix-turn-helix domain-containing protein [Denitrobacterium detoxificans]MBE6471630.1 helix-turn-helix domain-containing protein [Coriobacteriaceae bacterium]MBE6473856.1 helix-turn-helix domain-containing protein [Coriobacteriaceae bacterium]
MMADKLVTLEEAAQVMRCSYSKAAKIARAGTLPFIKLGANWVIAESALNRALGLAQGGDADDAKKSA